MMQKQSIAARSNYSRLIWIKNGLKDCGASSCMTLYYENIIFTQDLDASRFESLRSSLGLCVPSTV